MEEITVTGKSHGHDLSKSYPTGTLWLKDLDGRQARIRVSSQFGWEDCCQERDVKVLVNPRYVAGSAGTPQSVGQIRLIADAIEDEEV